MYCSATPFRHGIYILLLIALLPGCMVGPDFHSPHSPPVKDYIKDHTTTETVDKAQQFHLGQTIPAQWWRVFHSEHINHLIQL